MVFKTFDDLQVYSPHTYRISTLRDRYPPSTPPPFQGVFINGPIEIVVLFNSINVHFLK